MSKSVLLISRMAFVLLFLSLCLIIFQTYAAFLGCAIVGTAIGGIALGFLVIQAGEIRVSWLTPTTLLVSYAGGIVSTWLATTSPEEFAYFAKFRPYSLLCTSLAIIYALCAIVLLAGRLESPCFSPDRLPRRARKFEYLLAFSGFVIILLAYLGGNYGYGGVKVEEGTSRISAVGAVAELLVGPMVGMCGYIIGRSRSIPERVTYGLLCISCLFLIVPSGRRPIVLALMLLSIGLSLSGLLRRFRILHLILAAIALTTFAYLTTSYFYALRLSAWELGTAAQLSDQMSLAFEFLVSPALQERFSTLLSENIRERSFTIGYFADLIEATHKSGPLYGEALFFYLRSAIPSILDPSKNEILDYQQIENFVHPKLGLPAIDQANSVLTDGVTDFGVPGPLIYLLGIIILLRTVLWGLQKIPTPVSGLFAGLVLIHVALKPELTLSEYFVTIRNLSFVFLILALVEQFTTSRSPVPEPDSEQDAANDGRYRTESWPL